MRLREVLNHYHVWDARKIGTLLPRGKECIDVTITSPPYWNIKDYGVGRQIGFGQTYEEYLADVEAVFSTIYAATTSAGSLWIISDTFKQDGELRLLPFDITARLRASGWILQDVIIWQKDRTLPWSHQGKLRNIFEYVAFYSKTKQFKYHVAGVRDLADLKDYWVRYPERYSPDGKAPSRMWTFPIPRQGSWGESGNYVRHECPLPAELIERILLLTTDPGDVVLDPFAGSGAVLATAQAMRRRFVGVDLSTRYRRMFYERVLPTVRERHRSKSGADQRRNAAKARFATAVRTLRCLKYPKELVRLYRHRVGELHCSFVWVIPSRDRLSVRLLVSFPHRSLVPSRFLEDARAICSKWPLSKYTVKATVHPVTSLRTLRLALARAGLRENHRCHLYDNGKFYYWTRRRTVGALLADPDLLFQNERGSVHPLMISGLNVRIQPDNPAKVLEDVADED